MKGGSKEGVYLPLEEYSNHFYTPHHHTTPQSDLLYYTISITLTVLYSGADAGEGEILKKENIQEQKNSVKFIFLDFILMFLRKKWKNWAPF